MSEAFAHQFAVGLLLFAVAFLALSGLSDGVSNHRPTADVRTIRYVFAASLVAASVWLGAR